MRFLSLDVFRGMTLVLMLIVNNPGDWGAVYAPLLHADWHGCTLTDLVFPFFLFIVGVAVPFALGRRKESGSSGTELYKKIFFRVLLIFGIGLALNGFPYYHFSTIRVPGVLQRIALVYGVIAVLYLKCSTRVLFYILVTLLLAYWFALTQIPVPGYGYASLEPETNLGAWIDYFLLKGHLWSGSKTWDPEGLLSTLPAMGTGLLGVFTGHWLRREGTPADKINILFVAGGLCLLLGYFWDMVFPINKKIWTSSFVLFTGGLALLTLATLTWLIDIGGYKKWTIHFVYFGMNSMMVFVGSGILARLLGIIRWNHGQKMVSLKGFLYSGLQATGLPAKITSFLFALVFAFLFYLLLKTMYHKKLFWKL